LADVARGIQNTGSKVSNLAGTLTGAAKGGSMFGGLTGLGDETAATTAATGAPSAVQTAGGISSMNPIAGLLSGYKQYQTVNDQEDEMKRAQQAGLNAYSPYARTGAQANRQLSDSLAAGFNPGDLENDPGYQFRLQQGQKALNQGLAARGMGQSGAAMKAAQEYGQGFANSEYADAYNRWLQNNQQLAQKSGQGANIAGAQAGIYDQMGDIGANATGARNNAITGTLSGILSGRGIIGWDAAGNPIYG
jgi:hypothetical protein